MSAAIRAAWPNVTLVGGLLPWTLNPASATLHRATGAEGNHAERTSDGLGLF